MESVHGRVKTLWEKAYRRQGRSEKKNTLRNSEGLVY